MAHLHFSDHSKHHEYVRSCGLADADQCMRVSSALEAGTVSVPIPIFMHLYVTVLDWTDL